MTKKLPQVLKAELIAEVLKLHTQGVPDQEIANKLGYSRQTIQAWLKQDARDNAKAYRTAVEVEASTVVSERLQLLAQTRAVALEQYLKTKNSKDWSVLESQMKLEAAYLGLFTTRIEAKVTNVTQDSVDAELESLANELGFYDDTHSI